MEFEIITMHDLGSCSSAEQEIKQSSSRPLARFCFAPLFPLSVGKYQFYSVWKINSSGCLCTPQANYPSITHNHAWLCRWTGPAVTSAPLSCDCSVSWPPDSLAMGKKTASSPPFLSQNTRVAGGLEMVRYLLGQKLKYGTVTHVGEALIWEADTVWGDRLAAADTTEFGFLLYIICEDCTLQCWILL